MIKFYTMKNCVNCKILKTIMDTKKIEYEENEDEYMSIAKEHNIMSMPFAEIDGKIMDTKQLRNYIMKQKKEEL